MQLLIVGAVMLMRVIVMKRAKTEPENDRVYRAVEAT